MASTLQINPNPSQAQSKFKPLELYDPLFILLYLSFFSPFILIFSIMIYSVIFQNYKGFIYLAFIFALTFLRLCVYKAGNFSRNAINDKDRFEICDSVYTSLFSNQDNGRGNDTYSVYVFAFTFFYICLPMFMYNNINVAIVCVFVIGALVEFTVKRVFKCINMMEAILNFLVGSVFGIIITILLFKNKDTQKLLFINEVTSGSNKEVCSMANKQTFKCSVYKNGELLASTIQ
jgi:hypothetical protein